MSVRAFLFNPNAWWRRHNTTLALMLIALHLALVLDFGTNVSRAFLLAHFGLFLLWQPVWQGTQRLVPVQVALVIVGGVALVWWNSWWLVGLWIALLLSLIGGNVPAVRRRAQRMAALLGAAYLLATLLVWVVPHMSPAAKIPMFDQDIAVYVLALPIAAIFVFRTRPERDTPRYSVDLIYSVLLFLLVIVVVLGAVFVQQVGGQSYVAALVQTVLAIAAIMMLLSWLWDPRGGFAGLGQLFSGYLLSLGMPFERWMHRLANLADTETDPETFLARAVEEVQSLPWVSGIAWETAANRGHVGNITAVSSSFTFSGMTLQLFTTSQPGPSLLLHMRLLSRLLGDYYDAKVREQAQRRTAYLEAIYETGSRVTHDVKNLLQTLKSLCAAAENTGSSDAQALQQLIQRQLPHITQRLQTTLAKLESRSATVIEQVGAHEWWRSLVQRYSADRVEFDEPSWPPDAMLPGELFDSVAENFLQNALEKRRRGEAKRLRVALKFAAAGPELEVSDDGVAIPDTMVRSLFSGPVESENGLGVGLYQSARFAAAFGYTVSLLRNIDGEVTFAMRRAAGAAQSAKPAPTSIQANSGQHSSGEQTAKQSVR